MERKKLKERYKSDIEKVLRVNFMKTLEKATEYELYYAVAKVCMNEVVKSWQETEEKFRFCKLKKVYYFSQEFLPGRLLGNNMLNSNSAEIMKEILDERGIHFNYIEEKEREPALGNGGLGRLASCIMESLTTLGYSGCGCGIKYRNGFFKQEIKDGKQVELPDQWAKDGYPLGVERKELKQYVIFWGYPEIGVKIVEAVPFDIPVVGYPIDGRENLTVNTLRLWNAANAPEITEMLYPDDRTAEGKALRLKQQYFFVSASVQLIVKQFKEQYKDFSMFPKKVCLHLNDTHPTLVIPELMRILMDEEFLSWDEAWRITTASCAYTNHTIMAEAMEKWSIDMFEAMLPRIYEIIHEIDRRFVADIRNLYSGNEDKVKSMAILYDGQVRMANMAAAGSFSVNGVAKLHTEILKKRELKDFYDMMPEKFNNKTNGVTQRRFLLSANPMLSYWITSKSGNSDWVTEMEKIKQIEQFADDEDSQSEFLDIKYLNKMVLAKYIEKETDILVSPNAIFDVQIKRFHEYKRQLMNVLRIRYLYEELKNNPEFLESFYPTVFIFAGKSYPTYKNAKLVIKEIHKAADEINHDSSIREKIKVVFLKDYNVSKAEIIIPGSDVSEQISTASKEASGTGNMKFMMNGAITLGTFDGANVEIRDAVGEENMFLFGMNADEVMEHERKQDYIASHIYLKNEKIKKVVDKLDVELKNILIYEQSPTVDTDRYFVLKDLEDYIHATLEMNQVYQNRRKWAHMAIINVASSGCFSIDRTVREYAKEIWKIESIYED